MSTLALVTGGSRGIGLAIADAFARAGMDVVITSRKADALQTAAEQLRRHSTTITTEVCHQGDPAAIDALFARLDERKLVAEVAVINAATSPLMAPLVDLDLAAWTKIMDVNLTGAWYTARLAARRMLPGKKGSIVFLSSIAGLDPMPGVGAYSVSKAALISLAKGMAKELGPQGIRVNAIAPGLIDTKLSSAIMDNPEVYQEFTGGVPLGRHGVPEDVAGAALYLATGASSYMTGQVLVVDGGYRM